MAKIRIVSCLLILAVLCGCASKDDMQSVARRAYALEQQQAEISRLQNKFDERLIQAEIETAKKEKRLVALEKLLGESDKAKAEEMQAIRDQVARFGVDVDALRSDFRKVLGDVEENAHSLEKREESINRMEEIFSRMDVRLSRLEDFVDVEGKRKPGQAHQPAPAQAQPAPPATAPAAAPATAAPAPPTPPVVAAPVPVPTKPLGEKELFAKGKDEIEKGRWEEARASFAEFLSRFGESKLADNAQYYVGESYFNEKWYERAILEFQTVIEKYPAGDRVPAALLRQGMSFALMGDKDNARLIYKEIIKKYSKSTEATQAKKKLEDLK